MKYDVAMRILGYEIVNGVEAKSEEEAFANAKELSAYHAEGFQYELDEVRPIASPPQEGTEIKEI